MQQHIGAQHQACRTKITASLSSRTQRCTGVCASSKSYDKYWTETSSYDTQGPVVNVLSRADTFIQKTKKLYLDSRTQRNLTKLQADVQEVTSIMTKNIQEILGQGEKMTGAAPCFVLCWIVEICGFELRNSTDDELKAAQYVLLQGNPCECYHSRNNELKAAQ